MEHDHHAPNGHVVATVISAVHPNNVWVSYSDGRIWSIDWTTGVTSPFEVSSHKSISAMTVQVISTGKEKREIIFTVEETGKLSELVAYDATQDTRTRRQVVYSCNERLQGLWSASEGHFHLAISRRRIYVGDLESSTLSNFRYRFYSLEAIDDICSADIFSLPRKAQKGHHPQSAPPPAALINVAIGTVRGAIYVYRDILSKLRRPKTTNTRTMQLQPQKHHWHRTAVHAVKWSRDGKVAHNF
jgi:NET1-associated nuclear protein 1 (U3 small nucleolar RNA-associated protein 17)